MINPPRALPPRSRCRDARSMWRGLPLWHDSCPVGFLSTLQNFCLKGPPAVGAFIGADRRWVVAFIPADDTCRQAEKCPFKPQCVTAGEKRQKEAFSCAAHRSLPPSGFSPASPSAWLCRSALQPHRKAPRLPRTVSHLPIPTDCLERRSQR